MHFNRKPEGFLKTLRNGDIAVTFISLPEYLDKKALDLLTTEDYRDYCGIYVQKKRVQSLQMRVALREFCASILELPANDIVIHRKEFGKPWCPQKTKSGEQVYFSLSHSNTFGALAFSLNRELGIDIEARQERSNLSAIVRRMFSREEYDSWKELPEDRMTEAFYRSWTMKEAHGKMHGQGLQDDLKSFSIVHRFENNNLITLLSDSIKEPHLFVSPIAAPSGFQCAVAHTVPNQFSSNVGSHPSGSHNIQYF